MSHDKAQEERIEHGDVAQAPGSVVPSPGAGRLSRRELQVLELLADGRSNKEIAWQLRISVHMVKAHVSRVLEKLNVAGRTQAAVFYVKSGWERSAPGSREEQEGKTDTKKGA